MPKNYYEILGVGKNASREEIKKAYRKMAHQYHPDKKGGDEKKFKEINEAYQVLGDDSKRKRYDTFGSADFSQGGDGFGQGWGGFKGFDFGADVGADLGSIFEDFFGGLEGFGARRSQGRERRERGSDIALGIDISFQDSVFGAKRNIVIERSKKCGVCLGSGGEPGSAIKKCGTCHGTGTIREQRRSLFGVFTSLVECPHCKGRGEIPEKICKNCRGAGIFKKPETIDIEIPAGIRDGEAVKMTGFGEEVPRGQAGDLYVRFHVLPHPIFRREGVDILMELSLPLSKMLLGGEETVDTLEGRVLIKIPELSKAGDFLRLRQKGVPRQKGGRGDLLIRLFPKLPKRLSQEAKKLLSDLEKEGI